MRVLAVIVSIVVGVVLAACASGEPDDRVEDDPDPASVRIASFEFTESRILAELYAQALDAAGVPVHRSGALASREILEPALEQDVVDLVPEYTGSALEFVNKNAGRATADPVANHRLLREAFTGRGLEVLEMAPAQNQNAVAVTKATSDRLTLSDVSDLEPHAPSLVFGGPPECAERPFCLRGLESVYGLRFKELRTLDAAGPATVGALEGGEIDVALLFTTSPQVEPKGFVLLVDDRGLQPADNVVPVVRREQAERHGDRLRSALDSVSAALTTEELRRLNAAVDLDGRSVRDVVAAWIEEHGLAA